MYGGDGAHGSGEGYGERKRAGRDLGSLERQFLDQLPRVHLEPLRKKVLRRQGTSGRSILVQGGSQAWSGSLSGQRTDISLAGVQLRNKPATRSIILSVGRETQTFRRRTQLTAIGWIIVETKSIITANRMEKQQKPQSWSRNARSPRL